MNGSVVYNIHVMKTWLVTRFTSVIGVERRTEIKSPHILKSLRTILHTFLYLVMCCDTVLSLQLLDLSCRGNVQYNIHASKLDFIVYGQICELSKSLK